MPLQRVPPAENFETASYHHSTLVHYRLDDVGSTGVLLRNPTANPFVLLKRASVSLKMAFEIGLALVPLDVSTHFAGKVAQFLRVEWGSELGMPGPGPLETVVSRNRGSRPRPSGRGRARTITRRGRRGIGGGTRAIGIVVDRAVAKGWTR